MEGRAQVTSTSRAALLRQGARAVAAGRVALGLTALAWPSVPARPWVGAAADDVAARVFGRALGRAAADPRGFAREAVCPRWDEAVNARRQVMRPRAVLDRRTRGPADVVTGW